MCLAQLLKRGYPVTTLPFGVLARKPLPGGRYADVTLLTYNRARLHVGRGDDTFGYLDEW